MKMKQVFVISGVKDENHNDLQWELSELSRKFPEATLSWKKDGRVSSPYQTFPVIDEPWS